LDTDHFSPLSSNALWVWKEFLRGHNPILYDLGFLGGGVPPDPSEGEPSFDSLEPARYAMGDTRGIAQHAATMPRTAVRYAIEHLPPDTRDHYLKRKKQVPARQSDEPDRQDHFH